MAMFECELPRVVQFLMKGGNTFSTTVNIGFSGHEARNRNRRFSRKKWNISYGYRKREEYEFLRDMFMVVAGRADSFRLYDWTDHSGFGQPLGTIATPNNPSIPTVGDGATTQFQLINLYTVGPRSYIREVTKPITTSVVDFEGNALDNTVIVYINGNPTAATVDYTTGIVTFSVAPAAADILTSDFEFDIPVRFDIDEEGTQADPSPKEDRIFSWPSLTVIETFPPNY